MDFPKHHRELITSEDLPGIDIDVLDPTLEGYRAVVDQIHARDVQRAGNNIFHGVPITSKAQGWRRINLRHDGMPTVSLVIDETDGYLIGFRRGDGTWMRFSDKQLPNVPGTQQRVPGTRIQLKSSYLELIKEKERAHFSVGKFSLSNSYHILLKYDERIGLDHPKMKKQRKALTQLIIMFCEVSRITPVLDFICQVMSTGETVPLDENLWTWIKNWSTFSQFALHCKEREDQGLSLDPDEVERVTVYHVTSREEVLGVLHLILSRST